MNTNGIYLDGFDAFLEAVKKMPDQMKVSTMKGIIKQNMKPIAAAIKARTPVRTGQKSAIIRRRKDGSISTSSMPGNLRASINVKTFSKGKDLTGYAGIQKGKNDGWYGFFVERGTRSIPKKPFIAPAAAITIPIAADNLTTDIKNYIVKNAKKLNLDAK
jgi:HK97 gp10 family phage protein